MNDGIVYFLMVLLWLVFICYDMYLSDIQRRYS